MLVVFAVLGFAVAVGSMIYAVRVARPTAAMQELVATETANRVNSTLLKEFEALTRVDTLQEEKLDLVEQISKLRAERDAEFIRAGAEKTARDEDYNRKERELTHKAGLLAQQHTADISIATRQAELKAQEAIVKVQADAQEKLTKFQQARFESEVQNLNKTVEALIEQVRVIATPGAAQSRVRVDA